MPKPFYGETAQLIEAGEYPAVITQVINLGHQRFKDREITKFWIEFWIPNMNTSRHLSNFGITSWLSPSKPPFVGFYELITAVESKATMSQDELKEYDLYSIAGKSVNVTFELNEKGYMNISKVTPYNGTAALTHDQEIITVGVEDFDTVEVMDKLRRINEKAVALIWGSSEYINSVKSSISSGSKDEDVQEISLTDIPF